MSARRSCLSVPGSSQKMLGKAAGLVADELVLDLEDAVPVSGKDDARERVIATLASGALSGRAVAVRVNGLGSPWCYRDVMMLVEQAGRAIQSLVLPKVDRADDIEWMDRLLGMLGEVAVEIRLQALIETAAGLAAAAQIAAASPRLDALILGYADLAASLGRVGGPNDAPEQWLHAQEMVLTAARGSLIQAIDGPYLAIRDGEGLRRRAQHARDLGFDGKWAVHPTQVAVLNDVFTPSAAEFDYAVSLLAVLERAERGTGRGAVEFADEMVDEASRKLAEHVVARHRAAAEVAAPRGGNIPKASAAQSASDVSPSTVAPVRIGGPWFEDFRRGQVFRDAPGLTLTAGHAALHQAISGDRLRLALDSDLARAVTGRDTLLANPALVCDIAIGQTTGASQRVRANLFYRGLVFARQVFLGDTLHTHAEVAALKQNRRREGAPVTGLVVLRVRSTDGQANPVLDFWRCPMIPLRDPHADTGHFDDVARVAPGDLDDAAVRSAVPAGWDLAPLREDAPGPFAADLNPGMVFSVEAGETVTAAPELARLTLNMASAHTDVSAGLNGRRLVYGGHTISIAAAHATRAFPALATVLAWVGCDHLGPVFEGDLLRTKLHVERVEQLPTGGGMVTVRAVVSAHSTAATPDGTPQPVLDWRFVALLA
jgi:citrate lyase beta subunit/acyl dehydratase